MTSILEHFQGTPRPQQEYALKELERYWDRYDVFVISAPVATGKSLISQAVSSWTGSATILTPTNLLVDQYRRDFPDMAYLQRKDLYPCLKECDKYKCRKPLKVCKECPYKAAKAKFLKSDVGVCNYYMYVSMRKHHNYQTRNIIIDEAHNLIPTLADMGSVQLWRHKYKYPDNLRTEGDILNWIEDAGLAKQKKFKPIVESFYEDKPLYQFERTVLPYRGHMEELINVRPVSVREAKPVMWPWCIQKIVLLSATIGPADIKELGLDRKRVRFIDTSSPIPPINRPVFYRPVGSMGYRNMNANMPKVAEFVHTCLDNFKSKGIIHTTYSMARRLQYQLDHPRLIWHTQDNKKEKYQEYLRSSDGVLVACGFAEGIDLAGDDGRWQVITKVPFPSLVDSAVKYKADLEPQWYKWLAIKEILQATGRVCRTPTDIGYTFIIDSNFGHLYHNHSDMWPKWFRSAVIT